MKKKEVVTPLTTRAKPSDQAIWRAQADKENKTYSEWVRDVLNAEIARIKK